MNPWPALWSDLRTAIVTVWPEVQLNFREEEILTRHIMDDMETGKVSAPYVVVITPAFTQSGRYALDRRQKEGDVSLLYIAEKDGNDSSASLEERLSAMEDYLSTQGKLTGCQVVPPGFSVDVTPRNPVNIWFHPQQSDFQGGTLTFRCLVGP